MKARLKFWCTLLLAFSLFSQISFVETMAINAAGCEGIIGQWRWFNGATVTCSDEGTCTATNGFSGPWRCLDASGKFEIRWGRGEQQAMYIDTLHLSMDETQLTGKNQLGAGLSASRVSGERLKPDSEINHSLDEHSQFRTSISAQQQQLVDEFGWPQSFLVTFSTEENDGKRHNFRFETWYYYNVWTSFSFINGVFNESAGIDKFTGDVNPLPYKPYDFNRGLQWHEVQRIAGHQKFVQLTPHDLGWDDLVGVQNVNVYFAGQTIAGFDGGGLTILLALPKVTAKQ